MAGRPNIVEELVLRYVEEKPDPVLDLELDRPALERLSREVRGSEFDLDSAVKRLTAKRYLHRLQNGRYVVRSEPARSPRLWSLDPVAEAVLRRLDRDYYVSWHAALWHYGLIDQQSRRISVAIEKEHDGKEWSKRAVHLGRSRIEFVRLSERKFFRRAVEVQELEWPVKFSTMSRALIDAFDRPDLVGPPPVVVEALRRAWLDKGLDPVEFVQDALELNSPTLNRRLGFFMELLEIPGAEPLALRTGRRYAEPLFPGRQPKGELEVDPRWRVYLDRGLISTALELK
jgi:predicted transcriptional regulator of viral defense system